MKSSILLLFILFFAEIHAVGYCDPKLKRAFDTAVSLDETKVLWERINREGEVRIFAKHGNQNNFKAYWEGEERIICVNLGLKPTVGEQVSSLLFEMHNALRDKKTVSLYNQAAQRRISKETFAREMERVEYENSLDACTLLEKGVKAGIYPQECYLQRYANFESFLNAQKMHGHFHHYLRTYNEIQGIAFH